jgi:hypothetical protein
MALKIVLSIALLSTILTACTSKPDASDFVGKWRLIGEEEVVVEFVRNGDSVIFIDVDEKFATTLNADSTLQVSMPSRGIVIFAYSQNSDTIVADGEEFKRFK